MQRMRPITPAEAQAYLNRWKLVLERETAELRSTSMETKARQLAVLMASRNLFQHDDARDEEICEVRKRWAVIRSAWQIKRQ